ncbi:MAG TPA: tetratricopeptide repeat protein, partial [Gemmataceae bacterium]|nr:tetratricopeptide repeat protein [Gemmataceae bacterium]
RDHADLGGPLVEAAQDAMRRGQRLDIETERLLAALAQRAHQLEAAEQFFRLCLDGRPGRQSDFEIYYGLLSTLSQEHKPQEVVALCRRGLKEAPLVNRRLFHDYLARALAMLGKDDEALAAADQVVDLAGADTRVAARLFRADILRVVGRYDKGIAECQALLQETHDPKEVHDIRYTLSGIYSAARQIAKAEATLRLILEKEPDDATANNDLGYMLADEGKSLPEAEAMIRKAIRLEREQRRKGKGVQVGLDDDQDHAAYLDSLGWVLFRRGQVREGLAQLKKAAALPDGEDPVIWDHLGDVYFRLDRLEKARTAWQKAVSLYESAATGRRPDAQYKNIKHKLRLLATNARLKSSHAADSERPGPQR